MFHPLLRGLFLAQKTNNGGWSISSLIGIFSLKNGRPEKRPHSHEGMKRETLILPHARRRLRDSKSRALTQTQRYPRTGKNGRLIRFLPFAIPQKEQHQRKETITVISKYNYQQKHQQKHQQKYKYKYK